MRQIIAEPLSPDAFAPYGDVLTPPPGVGRTFFDGALGNLRGAARPSLAISRVAPVTNLPLLAKVMERHEFSSQSFIPLEPARYLVLVAPEAEDGGPDTEQVRAFLAEGHQGITYRANVWHHPLSVLERPTLFAVVMWMTGGAGDEEFRDVARPFEVAVQSR